MVTTFSVPLSHQTSSQLCNEIQHLREYLLGQNVTVIVSQVRTVRSCLKGRMMSKVKGTCAEMVLYQERAAQI